MNTQGTARREHFFIVHGTNIDFDYSYDPGGNKE